jgi:hypothetical protein
MTTNNEVKAPRPCTLWGQTFDSNKFKGFTVFSDTVSIVCGQYDMPTSEPTTDVPKTTMEAIQAIASAQRQWLKADGFEFEDGQQYEILRDAYHTRCVGFFKNHKDMGLGFYNSMHEEAEIVIFLEAAISFKPYLEWEINDTPEQRHAKEQEAWEAVSHVEVCKKSTDKTQANKRKEVSDG